MILKWETVRAKRLETASSFRLRQTRHHLGKNQAAIVAFVHAIGKVCQA